nr:hypothetical protein [Candidatus Hamiltonella defensa]
MIFKKLKHFVLMSTLFSILLGISGRRSKDTKGASINLNFTQSLSKGMYFGVVLDRNLNNGVSKQIDAKNIVPAMAFYMGWDQNDNRHGWG